ncbi:class I SAM-dependent methyltransferase [Niabella beijingensis]|uniref:class I SAM-dependent methyltransferase n=1 Tax=Niabella beijingensis TaxID=2872700 RepID=UPI001CBAB5AC|nr:methyltransferase domain-containing protein [Niabella beijingensis]MBZ4191097.1 class I SAM-dependent methyltransferase [Niabella beijingensis]
MNFTESLITKVSYLKNPFKRGTINYAKTFKNQIGIEIGGPSSSFGLKSFFPVYLYAKRIDGVNFSSNTIWEGQIKEGQTYKYEQNKPAAHQYIDEAAELSSVPNESYDFLLSCHSLEHVANPIKAVKRWNEVLKTKGRLCLVLPDKRYTFDHNRPYTTFEHLLADFGQRITERDDTHFEEVIRLHDLSMDQAQSKEELIDRIQNNYINRCMHHHVFSFESVTQMLEYCGFKTVLNKEFKPFHLFILAEKTS